MIYLIHGQNQVDSRRFLLRLKSNYQNVEAFSGKKINGTNFLKSIKEGSSLLFGGKEAILIEGFEGNWELFTNQEINGLDIILWANKKIDIGSVKVRSFLFDQQKNLTAFKFVDAILYKDEKEALLILDHLLKSKEPNEKIIGALARGFRLLYCAKEGELEKTKIPKFASQRIEEQEKYWNRAEIKRALIHLLHSDISIKEGQQPRVSLTSFVSRATLKS